MTVFFCLFGCYYSFSDKGSQEIMAVMSEIIKTDVTYLVKNTPAVFMSV